MGAHSNDYIYKYYIADERSDGFDELRLLEKEKEGKNVYIVVSSRLFKLLSPRGVHIYIYGI